jgi:hypothetical protein
MATKLIVDQIQKTSGTALTWPAADGANGEVLTTDGLGTLTFTAASNQLTTWTAEDGDGTTVTVGQGDTLKFTEGTDIDINFTDTTDPTFGITVGFTNATGYTTNTGTVTQVDGGAGLTGSVTTSGSLAVGAGTGVTVNANDIAIGQPVGTTNNVTFNDLVVSGTLTVQGTTTTIESSTLSVDDKNITMGDVTTPTDTTADGGGITLKGTTDKTIVWDDAQDNWTFNQDVNLSSSLVYRVNNAEVLDGSGNIPGNAASVTTATDATNASRSVVFTATTAGNASMLTDPGITYNPFDNVLTTTASSARYADLAENYVAETNHPVGTVLIFGGMKEVTKSTSKADRRLAGIVSLKPAYLMNSGLEAEYVATIALQGRVPCRVKGITHKGDLIVSSDTPGVAIAWNEEKDPPAGSIIGKSLVSKNTEAEEMIEVVVGVR